MTRHKNGVFFPFLFSGSQRIKQHFHVVNGKALLECTVLKSIDTLWNICLHAGHILFYSLHSASERTLHHGEWSDCAVRDVHAHALHAYDEAKWLSYVIKTSVANKWACQVEEIDLVLGANLVSLSPLSLRTASSVMVSFPF